MSALLRAKVIRRSTQSNLQWLDAAHRLCQQQTACAAASVASASASTSASDRRTPRRCIPASTRAISVAADRAALRAARGAGLTPNAVTDADMAEFRRHFDDEQIVEIVAVIANFGFLNRWNDTMATELEQAPLAWAGQHLAPQRWEPGKHAPVAPTDLDA